MPNDLQRELTERNLRCVAAVNESPRATDYAVALSGTRLVVVRQVQRATEEDHTALTTMISEGDFSWAGLVYSVKAKANWSGDLETFHVSELPRLIDRLEQLRGLGAP